MGANTIPSQQNPAVASLPPETAATPASANKSLRKGFNLVLTRIASGVKQCKKFFSRKFTSSATPASVASPSKRRLSVETPAGVTTQHRKECRQYLAASAQERRETALTLPRQFSAEVATGFTAMYDQAFTKEFETLRPANSLADAIEIADTNAKDTIYGQFLADVTYGSAVPETYEYMMSVFTAPDIEVRPSAPEQNASASASEILLPYPAPAPALGPVRDLMSEPVPDTVPAPTLMPTPAPLPVANINAAPTATPVSAPAPESVAARVLNETPVSQAAENSTPAQADPGQIKTRIFRSHQAARKMLISNPAIFGKTREDFGKFTAKLDNIYLQTFETVFKSARAQNYSILSSTGMAAERAYTVSATVMRDTAKAEGYDIGYRYAQDMLNDQVQVTELAMEMYDGPGKLLTVPAATQPEPAAPIAGSVQIISNLKARIGMANSRAMESLIGNHMDSFAKFLKRHEQAHAVAFDRYFKTLYAKNPSKSSAIYLAANTAANKKFAQDILRTSNDRYERRYAQRLLRNVDPIQVMTRQLVSATKSMSIEEARISLQTSLAPDAKTMMSALQK